MPKIHRKFDNRCPALCNVIGRGSGLNGKRTDEKVVGRVTRAGPDNPPNANMSVRKTHPRSQSVAGGGQRKAPHKRRKKKNPDIKVDRYRSFGSSSKIAHNDEKSNHPYLQLIKQLGQENPKTRGEQGDASEDDDDDESEGAPQAIYIPSAKKKASFWYRLQSKHTAEMDGLLHYAKPADFMTQLRLAGYLTFDYTDFAAEPINKRSCSDWVFNRARLTKLTDSN